MTGSASAPRVLLDATSIPADEGGVARYLRGLITGLASREGIDLVIATDARHVRWVSFSYPAATVVTVPRFVRRPWVRLLWEQVQLPRLARNLEASIIHSPHYTFPLLTRRPIVVTAHDATFFSHPQMHSPLKRHFFRMWLSLDVRRATVVVAPSSATLSEIERFTGRRPRASVVAYHGVDIARFSPPSEAALSGLRDRLRLGSNRWIAFLGTIEPRKNVGQLVRGFDLLSRRGGLPPDVHLLLAGAPGWDNTVDGAIRDSTVRDRVHRLGPVPDADLAPLLGGAVCVVYPSSGEGFGLPVLEAMATGAPVITTRELALPEVGGDSVLYCGTEPASIAGAIESLLISPERAREYGRAGLERATQFTWEASARNHEHAYLLAFSAAGARP